MARSATAEARPVTAEELLQIPDDGLRRELVRGEVRTMTPAGARHGRIAMRIGSRLEQHVSAHGLGRVYAAETGFRLASEPDTVRAPDAAFVSAEREREFGDLAGFLPGAPDLAVEVVSPSDSFRDMEAKVDEWLSAGCRMVVVVSPDSRRVFVYRSPTGIQVLTEDDELDCGEVVPGWRVSVREIFE